MGIPLADIAVVSVRSRSGSALQKAERLGDFAVRRFTGLYTLNGEPCWSPGELLVESVYRFKKQSAAGVVLSEVDFAEQGESERRKLFVGLTRGHLAVVVVLSRAAEGCLATVLRL